jgi:methionyl-tRNA formyltransferase
MVASAMLGEVILLTGEVEAPHLAALLCHYNPTLRVRHAPDVATLRAFCAEPPPPTGRRVIAFCTSVIVPADVIAALDAPAYNFHPAPPEYPGSHPASFAVYEGAQRYGVTVHEMTFKVDDGVIVAVDRFDIPPGLRFVDLELHAYKALVALFSALAERMATDPAPLAPCGETWSGTKTTKRDFARMGEVTEEMDEEEIKRRFRAFG